MKESICWTCKNAYINKCFWIGSKRQIWNKAKKEKRHEWKRNKDYYVYIVEQCEYYEPETQRKRCAY